VQRKDAELETGVNHFFPLLTVRPCMTESPRKSLIRAAPVWANGSLSRCLLHLVVTCWTMTSMVKSYSEITHMVVSTLRVSMNTTAGSAYWRWQKKFGRITIRQSLSSHKGWKAWTRSVWGWLHQNNLYLLLSPSSQGEARVPQRIHIAVIDDDIFAEAGLGKRTHPPAAPRKRSRK
jgi:hypothetical protein